MKKIVTLMLVLALVASCACFTASAEDETYTFTVLTYQAGVLDDDAYMVNYWNEYYGVNFVIESVEQGSESEILPLRLASDDVPDILKWSRANLMNLVEEGLFGTVSYDVLQQYAPKVYEEMAAHDGLLDYCSIDGELFAFGYMPSTSQYPAIAVWRKSWLDAIGEEVPTTLEDAERCWYAFAKNDPDGNGVDDTYGLSKGGMTQVYNAYGLTTTWIRDEEGKLINSNVSPRRREALEKLAQYYADGVLDPEFITGENNGGYWAVSHAFTGGRIGYTQFGNYTHWPMSNGRTNEETFANAGAIYQNFPEEVTEDSMPYVFAEPLEGPYGDVSYGAASFDTTTGFSANFVADEARLGRFLEIAQDLGGYNDVETYITARYGVKGVHWDYDENGMPTSFEGYDTVADRVAIGGLITFQFAMSDAAEPSILDIDDISGFTALQALNYQTVINPVPNKLPSAGDYEEELNKLTSETFMDIITGAKPIEAFDEMVETWYAIGGDILTAEANEIYG